jgi:DNA-binding transcriptional LysR family regulator
MLTEAGELLLNHANDILASIVAAKADMGDLQGGRSGDVRVGFFPGVPTRILAPTLVEFGKRHPGARVAARESPTDAPLLDLLRQGSIDMAFAYLPVEPGPFATYELMTVPWALVVPASADIARRARTPTAEEIARLPFIGGHSGEPEEWSKGDFGAAIGARRIVFRSDSTETVQALAGAGLGAAIVLRLAVHEGDPRTAIIDLSEYLPPASVGVAWLDDYEFGGALGHFLELLIEVCAVLSCHQDAPQPVAA